MAEKKRKKEPEDDDGQANSGEPQEGAKPDGDEAETGEGGDGGPEATKGRRFSILTLLEIALGVGVFVALLFVVHWLAAVSIAAAVFVFLDAAINHVNRVMPSSGESRIAILVWSLVGFVPFAGVLAYVVVRRKLASAPAAEVATGKEAVETVKRRMRAVPIPTAVVVAAAAVALALLTLKAPEKFTIEFGTRLTRALRMEGTTSDNTYSVGTVYVKLMSVEPIEGYADVDWKLFLRGSGRDPIGKGSVRVHPQSDKTIWVWKVGVRVPGKYRLIVVDNTGSVVKQGYFTAVPKTR